MTKLDRWGDPIEDDTDTSPQDGDVHRGDNHQQHRCDAGWLGEDHAGRPRPCLICRPHLVRRLAHR